MFHLHRVTQSSPPPPTTPPGRRRSRSIRPSLACADGCDVSHVRHRAGEGTTAEVMAVIGPPIVLFFQTTHRHHHSGTRAGTHVMNDAWLAVQSIDRSIQSVGSVGSDVPSRHSTPSRLHRAPVLPITPPPVVGGLVPWSETPTLNPPFLAVTDAILSCPVEQSNRLSAPVSSAR